ncbi:hypothetical protein HMSSN036_79110 [Paenibacillus macerans]|nr:hypothetical protein HMSSN036_79110 [Paenibacillus macerans]
MLNLLLAEILKSKRTFARKLACGAPLFFVLFAIVVKMLMPDQTIGGWDALLFMVFNWWPVLFVPVGNALLCGLTEAREKNRAPNAPCGRCRFRPGVCGWPKRLFWPATRWRPPPFWSRR